MASFTKDDTFKNDVLESPIPVLVDFMADWCQPCKQLAPILDEISHTLEGKVKILKMNIDENTVVPSSIGIRSIPTLILYKDGKQVSVYQSSFSKQKLLEWLQNV